MRPAEVCHAWVVYRMILYGQKYGGNVVCEQREWDAIEPARPGLHLLIRAGLATEQEAEKLARGTAGDLYQRGIGKKPSRRDAADRVPPTPRVL